MKSSTRLSCGLVALTALTTVYSSSTAQPRVRESAVEYDVSIARKVMVPMRDGVRLAIDIYRPAKDGVPVPGAFPSILLKHPYGRAGAERDGMYYAQRGYVFIMSDCRGARDSEGVYYLYTNDGRDGHDLVEWIAAQTWSNGKVATDGGSHSGYTQYATAITRPEHLTAQFIREASEDYHEGGAYQGGAMLLEHNLSYAISRTSDINNVQTRPEVQQRMRLAREREHEWMRQPPVRHLELFHDVPETAKWYRDWITHPEYDDYWKQPGLNLREHYGKYPDIPVYLLGGWYDYFLGGTLRAYVGLRSGGRATKRLIVGPWIHGPHNVGSSSHGEVDFGSAAALDFLALRERWMSQWLKGVDTGITRESAVRLFVMGTGDGRRTADGKLLHGGTWRDEESWPLPRAKPTRFYLHADGTLRPDLPAQGPTSTFVFDPSNPVPTIVGFGGYDQRCRADIPYCRDTLPLAARPDILVFRTPPLERDTEVTGPIVARILAATDGNDTDFTAKLIDEYPASPDFPQGFALILNDGVIRGRYRNSLSKAEPLVPGRVETYAIDLWATSNVFKKGHRIRLDISSSNFPKFDVNTNTGGRMASDVDRRVARNTIYHDPQRASYVELPLVPSGSGSPTANARPRGK
jgi:uncharacterized protein